MKLSYRNRVGFYIMISTAFFTGLILLGIYGIVYKTIYDHLDEDLRFESEEVLNSIVIIDGNIIFANENEWTEREHRQIEVNPTFIQVTEISGKVLRRSPNLKDTVLYLENGASKTIFFNSTLSGSPVRQFQLPVTNNSGKPVCILSMAIPLKDSLSFLQNLMYIMLVSYPLILIPLFFVSRLIAGKSIGPILTLKTTAAGITSKNLKERIALPSHQDELYELISTINNLLNRLEESIEKEHQFTADASHELRTPLSVMKGTLEVLVRRPRNTKEYEDNIQLVISEIDRVSELVNQMLYLARLDSSPVKVESEYIDLSKIIETILYRLSERTEEKKLDILFKYNDGFRVKANQNMAELMIENLISNAIKYTPKEKTIRIELLADSDSKTFRVIDEGPGISEDEIRKIFKRFHRSDTSRTSKIPGYGLGLSIVKKLADIQQLKLEVSNNPYMGAAFSIIFPAK